MAYSPSPTSLAIAGNTALFNRYSALPPASLPISKRDKKRIHMADRLTQISVDFAENRDILYRRKHQEYQADLGFIHSANPYEDKPLEEPEYDGSEDAAGSAAASTQGSLCNPHLAQLNGHPRQEVPFLKSGKNSSDFVQEINDAMEQRDVDLSTVAVSYPSTFTLLATKTATVPVSPTLTLMTVPTQLSNR